MYILCSAEFNDELHNRIVRGGCDVQEVNVGEEEELEGAIATTTESDGNYPNNACQHWNIMTSPSKVKLKVIALLSQQPLHVTPLTCCVAVLVI